MVVAGPERGAMITTATVTCTIRRSRIPGDASAVADHGVWGAVAVGCDGATTPRPCRRAPPRRPSGRASDSTPIERAHRRRLERVEEQIGRSPLRIVGSARSACPGTRSRRARPHGDHGAGPRPPRPALDLAARWTSGGPARAARRRGRRARGTEASSRERAVFHWHKAPPRSRTRSWMLATCLGHRRHRFPERDREMVTGVPLDALLVESDGPWKYGAIRGTASGRGSPAGWPRRSRAEGLPSRTRCSSSRRIPAACSTSSGLTQTTHRRLPGAELALVSTLPDGSAPFPASSRSMGSAPARTATSTPAGRRIDAGGAALARFDFRGCGGHPAARTRRPSARVGRCPRVLALLECHPRVDRRFGSWVEPRRLRALHLAAERAGFRRDVERAREPGGAGRRRAALAGIGSVPAGALFHRTPCAVGVACHLAIPARRTRSSRGARDDPARARAEPCDLVIIRAPTIASPIRATAGTRSPKPRLALALSP